MAKRGPKPKKALDPYRRPDGTVDYTLARTVKRQLRKIERRKRAEKNRDRIFEKGTRVEYLVCPLCYRRVPWFVKTDSGGNPIIRDEVGVTRRIYHLKDGTSTFRFFTGPLSDYRPVVPYYFYGPYGCLPRPEEALTPQQLHRYFNSFYADFTEAVHRACKTFPDDFR
jgi:hypothetical protein